MALEKCSLYFVLTPPTQDSPRWTMESEVSKMMMTMMVAKMMVKMVVAKMIVKMVAKMKVKMVAMNTVMEMKIITRAKI